MTHSAVDSFRAFEYMAWAKDHSFRHAFPLHDSAAPTIQPATLIANLDELRLDVSPGAMGTPELRTAIAAWQSRFASINGIAGTVGPDDVLVSQGTSYANLLVCLALIAPGAPVLVESPAYPAFDRLVRLMHGEPIPFERPADCDFRIDVGALDARWAEHPACRLVALSNLHNPSGHALNLDTLRGIGEVAAARDGYVLMDEVYLDLAPDDLLLPAAAVSERFVSTSSLTKCYGLGNLRVGWLVTRDPWLRTRLLEVNDIGAVNVSTVDQAIALACQGRADEIRARNRELIGGNREILRGWADGRDDLDHLEAVGGTVDLLDLHGRDCRALVAHAIEHYDCCVTPGAFFDMPGWLRIAVQDPDPKRYAESLHRLGLALDAVPPP